MEHAEAFHIVSGCQTGEKFNITAVAAVAVEVYHPGGF
jgi:hypothetical protein